MGAFSWEERASKAGDLGPVPNPEGRASVPQGEEALVAGRRRGHARAWPRRTPALGGWVAPTSNAGDLGPGSNPEGRAALSFKVTFEPYADFA